MEEEKIAVFLEEAKAFPWFENSGIPNEKTIWFFPFMMRVTDYGECNILKFGNLKFIRWRILPKKKSAMMR